MFQEILLDIIIFIFSIYGFLQLRMSQNTYCSEKIRHILSKKPIRIFDTGNGVMIPRMYQSKLNFYLGSAVLNILRNLFTKLSK